MDCSRTTGLYCAALLALLLSSLSCSQNAERANWNKRWGPMVPHTRFPGDCSLCHVTDDWSVINPDFEFDHAKETGFALTGAHADAACLRCHNDRGPVAIYVERGCSGCHVDPHESDLGMSCEQCHDESTWRSMKMFGEHGQTRFPLTASHALAPCESCHARASSGDFSSAPVECHLCHQRETLLARPNHPVNGWVVGCQECHNPSSWQAPEFDHSIYFVIDGAHTALTCEGCHAGGRVAGTPNNCFGCHQLDYLTAPNHVSGGYSSDCTQCHSTTAWN